jgi:ubiquitin-conjugating enzyme E2 variant
MPAATDISARAPAHDELGRTTRALEVSFILLAGLLLGANAWRLVREGVLPHWWSPLVVAAAAIAADFVSGLVHWTADTWFSETMPVLGRRFLRPFRVHHVNPDDFLRRSFVDCNGDVAMLNTPMLIAALVVPVETGAGAALSLALTAFAAASLPTNQVHQWAHMPAPPAAVQWLQRQRIILSRGDHARHHQAPHVANYCIATGWCNRPLTAMGFFSWCERLVTWHFGLEPRADEQAFHERSVRLRPDQHQETA